MELPPETPIGNVVRVLAIDSGTVTSIPPAGVAVLQDDSKNWTTDAHRNRLVRIIYGAGTGQQRTILSNSNKLLTLNQPWVVSPSQTSVYVIVGMDAAQVLRDVFGGGSDVNAANPLQVFDPKVFGAVGGLVLSGTVTAVPGANQFTIPALADLGAGKFADATAPYRAFVLRDAGGAGAAPQGEMQAITGYVTGTGTFTTAAFTDAVAVGDEILILHPRLAEILDMLNNLGYEGATSLANKLTVARAALLDNLDAAVSTRAIPGDAMALTAAERLIVQALILIDGVPFNGANIDAAISSRSDHSPDDVRQSVCLIGDPANSIGKALYELYLNRLTADRAGYLDNINNAELANVIRDITQATGTFVFNEADAGDQTAFTLAITARSKIGGIWLDMVNVTQDTTIRVKHQIDGANYRTFETNAWVTTDEDGVLITGFTAYRNVQVSLQCGGGGAGNVNVPYALV